MTTESEIRDLVGRLRRYMMYHPIGSQHCLVMREAADMIEKLAGIQQTANKTAPITEGYVVKGGRNAGVSQITVRPPPPAPIRTTP